MMMMEKRHYFTVRNDKLSREWQVPKYAISPIVWSAVQHATFLCSWGCGSVMVYTAPSMPKLDSWRALQFHKSCAGSIFLQAVIQKKFRTEHNLLNHEISLTESWFQKFAEKIELTVWQHFYNFIYYYMLCVTPRCARCWPFRNPIHDDVRLHDSFSICGHFL